MVGRFFTSVGVEGGDGGGGGEDPDMGYLGVCDAVEWGTVVAVEDGVALVRKARLLVDMEGADRRPHRCGGNGSLDGWVNACAMG